MKEVWSKQKKRKEEILENQIFLGKKLKYILAVEFSVPNVAYISQEKAKMQRKIQARKQTTYKAIE